jgi:hypothetical protein
LIRLINFLLLTELLLPSTFKGASNQAVLWLDLVILTAGALHLIPGSLTLQSPLLLE